MRTALIYHIEKVVTELHPVPHPLLAHLKGRSVVLVGMMGTGKTYVGTALAERLGLPFVDSDAEIQNAARLSIPEIFEQYGEPFFRDREHHVIARLLREGQKVLATGGGAFLHPQTRAMIKQYGISIWLTADYEILVKRIKSQKRSPRPMLQGNVRANLQALLEARTPTYELADLTLETDKSPLPEVLDKLIEKLEAFG